MRSLGGALFSFAFGIAFGVPGLCVFIFLCLLKLQPESAPAWSRWLVGHSPLPPNIFSGQLFSELPQSESLWSAWGGAALLCVIGYSCMRSARDCLRPTNQTTDGEAEVELKTEHPRVGAVLEGDLKLLEAPTPGQEFLVSLFCRYIETSRSGTVRKSLFRQNQTIKIVEAADGWRLPFRFDVPADAPPSTVHDPWVDALSDMTGNDYAWYIEFCRADGWFVVPSEFPITLDAAPSGALPGQTGATPGWEGSPAQLLLKGDPEMVGKFTREARDFAWRITRAFFIVVIGFPLVIIVLGLAFHFLTQKN
jgi:hypothetical protein